MKPLFLVLCLLSGVAAFAQETRTFSLKPIEIAPGPRYFYGGQRLSGDFTALEVPFLELGDNEVWRYYRNAKTIRTVERVIAVVPLAYILFRGTRNSVTRSNYNTYYWVLGGSIVVDIGLAIVRNGVMRRAVMTYNQRLPRSAFGVMVEPLPDGRAAPGLGLVMKF
jgi:hypothetical protein